MEKKKNLLNYCMLKFAQEAKVLYHLPDERTALLSLTFDHRSLFRRVSTGCFMQDICFANVLYPQDLLFLLCLEAYVKGDNLVEQFSFAIDYPHYRCNWDTLYLEDKELSRYLCEEIFPEVSSKKQINFAAYRAISGLELTPDNVLEKFFHFGNLRSIKVGSLPKLEPCAETEMIDRAFDSLSARVDIDKLLTTKHDMYGRSILQTMFFKLPQIKKMADKKIFKFEDFFGLSDSYTTRLE